MKNNDVRVRFIEKIGKEKLTVFLVSNSSDIFYLSGFQGLVPQDREVFLLVIHEKFHLIAPKLYEQEALICETEMVQVHIDKERTGLLKTVAKLVTECKTKQCGFESEDLKYIEYELLVESCPGVSLVPLKGIVSKIRTVKSEGEIELIRRAQEISYEAYARALPDIKVGVREFEVRDILARQMRILGAEGESFDAIIAINQHAALPHYKTGVTKIQKGDLLLLDFGAKYRGYCGDTTRILFFGTPNNTIAKTYNLVLEAQENAIQNIKAGTTGEDGFKCASSIFEKAGVLDHFTHGLGHGIGLDVHEPPYLRAGMEAPLDVGMVFSIEPGLYYPDWGGIRIEDLVVCRENNVEILGSCNRDIVVV